MELTSNGSFIKLFCLSLLILLISISFLHFLSFEKNTFPVNFGENWYLLIAHPDDETMFFSPTLFEFEEMGAVLHILCVTSGNSDGKGLTRIKELYKASSIYGIPSNRVYILDPDEKIFSDGFVDWNITKLADLILERVKQQTLKGIITFDEWGVSGHSNHISCFKAIEIISKQWNNIKFFALKSVPLWRKYLGIFDVYLTKLLDGNSLNSYRILSKTNRSAYIMVNNYKSQMRWFRYLFLTFSRYLYINTFVLIN